jgi:hypothetical protein
MPPILRAEGRLYLSGYCEFFGDRRGREGAHRPHKAARVLLVVIASDSDAVARALEN